MKPYWKIVLLLLFGLLLIQPQGKSQVVIPENFCISETELKLFNLINNYRREKNLAAIPMSKNLCFVARLHVNDLFHNRPDTANCNLHSWSSKGAWTECCYGRDPANSSCMTSKPIELTTYAGKGYEIAFWESLDAIPEIVLDLWINSDASNDLILNSNTWKDKPWKALGIGIQGGYAVAWFGDLEDDEKGVKICDSAQPSHQLLERVIPVRETTESTYYLIFSSFKDRGQAEKEVQALRGRGFRNPSVVPSGDNFRVALGDYPSREQALEAKKKLGARYEKAWVLKQ